jgi:hypothetical protein
MPFEISVTLRPGIYELAALREGKLPGALPMATMRDRATAAAFNLPFV